MKRPMKTLGVRLDDEEERLLQAEAKERGLSLSAHVRDLLRQVRRNERERLLLAEVRELQQQIQLLDRRWKIALVAILVDAGKASPEEAEAFVRNLP